MNQNRPSTEHWFLQGTKAKLACGALSAEIELQWPTRGLRNLLLSGETVDGWLMGVDVALEEATERLWQPTDVYTRGSDLIATYRKPRGQPFTLQVYWRVVAPNDCQAAVVEAIVSIQTREWEAHPHVTLTSALAVDNSRVENGGVFFRSQHDWGYVEVSPPGDFTASTGETTAQRLCSSHWSYGNQFMERGVIRRLRLRGAFVPTAEAEDAVNQMRSDLLIEPLPLTT